MRTNVCLFLCLTLVLSFTAKGNEPYLKSEYYDNGNPSAIGYLVFDDEAQGEVRTGYWQYFYSDGRISQAGRYAKGLQEGRFTNWFANGSIESLGNYKKGKKNGYWELYYEGGSLKAAGKYSDDLPHGGWTHYFENGQEEVSGSYSNGLRQGKRVYHDENGNETWKGAFEDGLKEGEWVLESGNERLTEIYHEGLLNGLKKEILNEDGRVIGRDECEVTLGMKTGASRRSIFTEDGKSLAAQGMAYGEAPFGVWRMLENGEMVQKDLGPAPAQLIERRKYVEAEGKRLEELRALGKEDQKAKFGPQKFEVIMQPPTEMSMNALSSDGRSIDLTENNYSVLKSNPFSYEGLKQQGMEAQLKKAAAEKAKAEEEQEKEESKFLWIF